MPGNFKREDLRVIKTRKLLFDALPKLLERRNFIHITDNDLCEEAQLSRTAFYAHFYDKYDLLKNSLTNLKEELLKGGDSKTVINKYISENIKIIRNLAKGANAETLELLHDFAASFLGNPADRDKEDKKKKTDPKYIVLSNFFAGGILNLLLWQIKNDFPDNLQMINAHLIAIINMFQEWMDSPPESRIFDYPAGDLIC